MFVVVENTPGFLPEDEPQFFDSLSDAQHYAVGLAKGLAKFLTNAKVEQLNELTWRVRTPYPNALDRVVEIQAVGVSKRKPY